MDQNPPLTSIDIAIYTEDDYTFTSTDISDIDAALGSGICGTIIMANDNSETAKRRRRKMKMILDLIRALGGN